MVRGSIDDPFDLHDALTSHLILPGSTLYLRGGIYRGDFTSSLVGVTIKPYQSEHPMIDGSLTINGSDCTFEGIEIMYSGWTTRVSAQTGSNPTDLPISKNVSILGPRTTMRRCTFHDLAGPGFWSPSIDSTLEECLFYNNGWDAPDRGHGHGLYMQNATGTKTIKRCVFGGGYSDFAIHAYSEDGALEGFDVRECVSIGKRNLFGGLVPVDRLRVIRCIVWGGSLETGYGANVQNGSAVLADAILANGAQRVTRGTWESLVETGTETTIGNRVLVYGRVVIVCNEAQAASVAAPIAGRYTNAQNPAESITLAQGDPLPMMGWSVATPIAGDGPLTTFDPRFAVFLVTL